MNTAASSAAVKQLYDKHPYPSPNAGASLLRDIVGVLWFLFPGQDLAGWKVLDAGCGTGHRLAALAKAYRKTQFTGLDISATALEVGLQLAEKHQLKNLRFWQGDISELDALDQFDLIISTGVVHHLPDPARGVNKLCRLLSPEGMVLLWLYHRFGEFERLLQRELVLTLAGSGPASLDAGINLLAELKISLNPEQYGSGLLSQDDTSQITLDVDAFLNPIVHAYRFGEAMDLFAEAGIDWVAINGITTRNSSSLVDLDGLGNPDVTLSEKDMLGSDKLLSAYRGLPKLERLSVIELRTKPTGFSMLAGRQASLRKCGPRIGGNVTWPR
ncbi:MAG TPA: class I SAM-dependent methyltransferase [Candidatus Angelobacter sp.]